MKREGILIVFLLYAHCAPIRFPLYSYWWRWKGEAEGLRIALFWGSYCIPIGGGGTEGERVLIAVWLYPDCIIVFRENNDDAHAVLSTHPLYPSPLDLRISIAIALHPGVQQEEGGGGMSRGSEEGGGGGGKRGVF